MPIDGKPSKLTDSAILDLIEDFLVNHFGIDDVDPEDPGLFDMLQHISSLVELRQSTPESANSQLRES